MSTGRHVHTFTYVQHGDVLSVFSLVRRGIHPRRAGKVLHVKNKQAVQQCKSGIALRQSIAIDQNASRAAYAGMCRTETIGGILRGWYFGLDARAGAVTYA
jgi:hypothetical protein